MEKPFSYPLSLNDRLEQLVNNDYTADVFFKVGEAEELMFAHKTIITTASEVFYAQLNGQFEDAKMNSRENPIVIMDIQSSAFLQMLRFMYCEKVDLDCAMLVDLYYAAKKYLLVKLIKICEAFFKDVEDVLIVFNNNRRYEFDNINRICLYKIRDDPLKYFENSFFTDLDKKSLVMIMESPKINCNGTHLLEATQKWLKLNESRSEDNLDIKPNHNNRELHCKKLYAYYTFEYSTEIFTSIDINAKESLNFYGVGIFIGTKSTDATSIKLYVNILNNKTKTNCVTEMKVVPINDELYIYEMMFKKITMEKSSTYRIEIQMKANEQQMPSMFYLNFFEPANPNYKNFIGLTYTTQVKKNCMAYLLYNDNKSLLKLLNEA